MNFDGILFFPVTPFDADGRVDDDLLREHVATTLAHAPRRRLPRVRHRRVPRAVGRRGRARRAGRDRDGRRPRARRRRHGRTARPRRRPSPAPPPTPAPTRCWCCRRTSSAARRRDSSAYVEAVAAASALPVVDLPPRHRAVLGRHGAPARRATPRSSASRTASATSALAQQIVRAVAETGRDDFAFFNGLLTAELTQGAYRGHRHPAVLVGGVRDDPRDRERVLPRLRRRRRGAPRARCSTASTRRSCACATRRPGFGVSLIKAGLRLGGLPVGSVRAPLRRPDPRAGGAPRRASSPPGARCCDGDG